MAIHEHMESIDYPSRTLITELEGLGNEMARIAEYAKANQGIKAFTNNSDTNSFETKDTIYNSPHLTGVNKTAACLRASSGLIELTTRVVDISEIRLQDVSEHHVRLIRPIGAVSVAQFTDPELNFPVLPKIMQDKMIDDARETLGMIAEACNATEVLDKYIFKTMSAKDLRDRKGQQRELESEYWTEVFNSWVKS